MVMGSLTKKKLDLTNRNAMKEKYWAHNESRDMQLYVSGGVLNKISSGRNELLTKGGRTFVNFQALKYHFTLRDSTKH